MIDEHKEELAAMYALGIMEPREAHAFEEELRADPELRKFVDDLLQSSAAMVHACPSKAAPSHLREKILREIRQEKAPSASAVKSGETGKVIPFSRPRIAWLPWAIAAGFMVMCGWLYSDRTQLQRELADERGKEDVCQIQMATLQSMNNNTQRVATVLWDASRQTGIVRGDMPRPAANQDYQLWVLDDQYSQPVDAGVVTVDENGETKTMFKPKQKISGSTTFAISIEKKGGAPQPSNVVMKSTGQ